MPAMGPSSVRTMLLRGYAAIFSTSVFSAVLRGNLLLVSAVVRQAPSSGPYYVAPNGVTVMCPGVAVGDTFDINDLTYTRVDLPTLKSLVSTNSDWSQLETSCTTGVTDMSTLLLKKTQFNVDISSWDVSSVTDMQNMFAVRAPPSRVLLLLLHRCVAVPSSSLVPYTLALRSLLTPHGRPSLAAL
jgi:surface protein